MVSGSDGLFQSIKRTGLAFLNEWKFCSMEKHVANEQPDCNITCKGLLKSPFYEA